MAKSPDAFRTISEVADWLGVQAHVLRFWESKFTQVKPIKRAGGRRYYRPSDMLLLGGLKQLLHEDGLTIKGAQKLLREKGVAHVADMSQPLDDLTIAVIEGAADEVPDQPTDITETQSDPDQLVEDNADIFAGEEAVSDDAVSSEDAVDQSEDADPDELERVPDPEYAEHGTQLDASGVDLEDMEPVASIEEYDTTPAALETPTSTTSQDPDTAIKPSAEQRSSANDEAEENAPIMPSFRARARGSDAPKPEDTATPESVSTDATAEGSSSVEDSDDSFEITPPEADAVLAPKPRIIDVGLLPDIADYADEPSALSALSKIDRLSLAQADEIRPLLARLTRLRASMANPRKDIGKD